MESDGTILLTQDVMGKLKELGVGVYVEQCNELEEIINNYVTKKGGM